MAFIQYGTDIAFSHVMKWRPEGEIKVQIKKLFHGATAFLGTMLVTGTVHAGRTEGALPESGTLLLLGSGLMVFALYRINRNRKK